MDWKIVFALLAVSLLLFGCARGQQREAPAAGEGAEAPTDDSVGAAAAEGAVAGQGTEGPSGTGDGAGTTGGEAAPAGETTEGNGTTSSDVGNLFQIDTDQPVDGSGYEVPAAGE